MTNNDQLGWEERFDEMLEKYMKSDGTAIKLDDRKSIGLYYTATTIGYAKTKLKELFKRTISAARKEAVEEERRRISTEVRKIYPFGGYEDVIKKVLYIINNQ